MKKIILIFLSLFVLQLQAEMQLKHGSYVSESFNNSGADISGQHIDVVNFIGNNPQDITKANATIYNGKISNISSSGYNIRYIPEVGFGYEFGIYLTKIKLPRQNSALIHSNGNAFRQNSLTGAKNLIVDSPSSYIKTIDIYIGGLYNFVKVNKNYQPYIGIGYAKVNGNWYNSYFDINKLGQNDKRYGKEGKTKIDGHYVSAKIGFNFNENSNLELEYAKYKLHANSFRSFQNGSKSEFNRSSLNFINKLPKLTSDFEFYNFR